jgi:hypothetical protein
MPLLTPIDNYCERLSPGLMAEPLNALSNLSFIIAAWFLYRCYRKHGLRDLPVAVLIGMVFIVGVGSSLFHTFANNLTMLADIIPIMVFVLSYLFFALIRLLGFSKSKARLSLLVLLLASAATSFAPPELRFNGSVQYFPCLAALFLVAWKSHQKLLYLASAVFSCSLIFRSVDMALCNEFSEGTHFIWHLLNGVLLYVLVKVLINHLHTSRKLLD